MQGPTAALTQAVHRGALGPCKGWSTTCQSPPPVSCTCISCGPFNMDNNIDMTGFWSHTCSVPCSLCLPLGLSLPVPQSDVFTCPATMGQLWPGKPSKILYYLVSAAIFLQRSKPPPSSVLPWVLTTALVPCRALSVSIVTLLSCLRNSIIFLYIKPPLFKLCCGLHLLIGPRLIHTCQ